MTETDKTCERCQERLVFVNGVKYVMLRPVRISHCKNYRAGHPSRICCALAHTKADALDIFIAGERRDATVKGKA